MKTEDDERVEIRIGDGTLPLWMRRRDLEAGEGPVMPEPYHDENGPFADSYAHLGADGKIRRYRAVIGTREDIREVGDDDQ